MYCRYPQTTLLLSGDLKRIRVLIRNRESGPCVGLLEHVSSLEVTVLTTKIETGYRSTQGHREEEWTGVRECVFFFFPPPDP